MVVHLESIDVWWQWIADHEQKFNAIDWWDAVKHK